MLGGKKGAGWLWTGPLAGARERGLGVPQAGGSEGHRGGVWGADPCKVYVRWVLGLFEHGCEGRVRVLGRIIVAAELRARLRRDPRFEALDGAALAAAGVQSGHPILFYGLTGRSPRCITILFPTGRTLQFRHRDASLPEAAVEVVVDPGCWLLLW